MEFLEVDYLLIGNVWRHVKRLLLLVRFFMPPEASAESVLLFHFFCELRLRCRTLMAPSPDGFGKITSAAETFVAPH